MSEVWQDAAMYVKDPNMVGDLVGKRVRIWWDGDGVFYEADVTGFIDGFHTVVYTGDAEVYKENLLAPEKQSWQIYVGDQLESGQPFTYGVPTGTTEGPSKSETSAVEKPKRTSQSRRGSGFSYAEMVLTAMQNLENIKTGVSLVAIRKRMAQDFPETAQKATASFNNLTLKAIAKLVSEGKLERIKNSYRFTEVYFKERVRLQREEALRQGGEAGLQGELLREHAFKMDGGYGLFEHNIVARKELAEARAKRNAFLRDRRHLLLPFMPEGDNFLTKLDRELSEATKVVRAGITAKKDKKEPSLKNVNEGVYFPQEQQGVKPSDLGELELRYLQQEAKLKQQHVQQQQHLLVQQRLLHQTVQSTDKLVDVNVLPADDESVSRMMVLLGILPSRGTPSLTISGERCQKLPPLQVLQDGSLSMHDAGLLGTVICDSGPFQGYTIIWPGQPLPVSSQNQELMNWKNVYYLECRENVNALPRFNRVFSPLQESIQAHSAVLARATALRLADGSFVPHLTNHMRLTQGYASASNVPLGNLFSIEIKDPHTGMRRTITRQYCADAWYASLYRKLVQDFLSRRPDLVPAVHQMVPATVTIHARQHQQRALLLEQQQLHQRLYIGRQQEMQLNTLQQQYRSAKQQLDEGLKGEEERNIVGTTGGVDLAQEVKLEVGDSSALSIKINTSDPKHEEAHSNHADSDEFIQEKDGSGVELVFDPKDLLKDVQHVVVPPSILVPLHEHQVDGLSWMVHMYNHGMQMILGDQMGLGKTLQSIAFMAYLRDTMNVSGPFLIVVPLSVLSNWLIEIERFCPSLRAVRFHGPKDERARIKSEEMRDLKEFDAVVTTYEMLVSEANFFRRRFLWRLVVVDEGHRLKNDRSQLAQKLKQVPAYCKVLLTGTPLQNNLRELWALLHFLMPDVFTVATSERFEEGFDLLKGMCDVTRLRQARSLLSAVMLRRVKDQVQISLPSKTELTLLVQLSPVQHAFYRHLLVSQDRSQLEAIMAATRQMQLDDASTSATQNTANAVDYKKLMNLLLQLRKVCNHPYLLADFEESDDGDIEALVGASGKLQLLDRMLPRLKNDGHRVLLFTQFTSMLDILEEYCNVRGHEYVRLDGDTNRVQRRLDIRRFNAPDSPLFVFLISTRAGGLGINLASADTVILYDSDWNPQVDLQAMERAHRIGQTKPVRVYRMVCRGSVEERMVSRAEKKLYLNAMVAERQIDVSDSNAASSTTEIPNTAFGPSAMNKSEVASLIRFGANAIFEAERKDYTDDDLDALLGISEAPVSSLKEEESASQRMLVEVDLRQLEGVTYERKPTDRLSGGSTSQAIEEALNSVDTDGILGKRNRKQRIVMIDGKGSGIRGDIAVLASSFDDDQEGGVESPPVYRKRPRKSWLHMEECLICHGKEGDILKCAHCPRVAHASCLSTKGYSLSGGGVMGFACPQHRCGGCERTTSAAGGLLFRCINCASAFCEDCLPEDSVESIGRWAEMEKLGYTSKQAYWIKCERCLGGCDDCDTINDEQNESSLESDAERVTRSDTVDEDEEGPPSELSDSEIKLQCT